MCRNCFPRGMAPVRWLGDTLKITRKLGCSSCWGISLERLFWERSNDSSCVRWMESYRWSSRWREECDEGVKPLLMMKLSTRPTSSWQSKWGSSWEVPFIIMLRNWVDLRKRGFRFESSHQERRTSLIWLLPRSGNSRLGLTILVLISPAICCDLKQPSLRSMHLWMLEELYHESRFFKDPTTL